MLLSEMTVFYKAAENGNSMSNTSQEYSHMNFLHTKVQMMKMTRIHFFHHGPGRQLNFVLDRNTLLRKLGF